MTRYALLCGSAPNEFRQKKFNDLYNELLKNPSYSVTSFANGIDELTLEYALNNIFDEAAGESSCGVLLYLCVRKETDLNAKMIDVDCNVMLLGDDEIRKGVIAYYVDLAKKYEVDFQVVYDCDCEMLSDEELGWEKVAEEISLEARKMNYMRKFQ